MPARTPSPDPGFDSEYHPTEALEALAESEEAKRGAPETVLDEAVRLTDVDREEDYGHPYDNMLVTGGIWAAILRDKLKPGETITPKDVALCQIGTKLARETTKPKRDNLVDIAGYARVAERIIEREGA